MRKYVVVLPHEKQSEITKSILVEKISVNNKLRNSMLSLIHKKALNFFMNS